VCGVLQKKEGHWSGKRLLQFCINFSLSCSLKTDFSVWHTTVHVLISFLVIATKWAEISEQLNVDENFFWNMSLD